MTKFVVNKTQDEEILFAAFGSLPKGKDAAKALLVKEGEKLTGVVKEVCDSQVYKKIYKLKVDGQDKVVVVTGKTNLNDQMGYGTAKADRQVKEGDLIQITFKGTTKTGKGRPFYSFEVAIAQ